MTVLIIGPVRNPHIDLVESELTNLGVPTAVIDTDNIRETIGSIRLSSPHHGECEIQLANGDVVHPRELQSVWLRQNVTFRQIVSSATRFADESRDINEIVSQSEWYWFLNNLSFLTQNRLWVNSPSTDLQAESKLFQLYQAALVGLKIPTSLATNDLEKFTQFQSEFSGDIIVKPLSHSLGFYLPHHQQIFTNRLKDRKFSEQHLSSLGSPPRSFRNTSRRAKRFERLSLEARYRGRELSQEDPATHDDWRRYPKVVGQDGCGELDRNRWRCRTTSLPEDVRERCLALMKKLGLQFRGNGPDLTPERGIRVSRGELSRRLRLDRRNDRLADFERVGENPCGWSTRESGIRRRDYSVRSGAFAHRVPSFLVW